MPSKKIANHPELLADASAFVIFSVNNGALLHKIQLLKTTCNNELWSSTPRGPGPIASVCKDHLQIRMYHTVFHPAVATDPEIMILGWGRSRGGGGII